MNCPKCGNEIGENQKFCSNCGHATDNNADMPWLIQYFKEVIVVALAIFFIFVYGALIINNNNTPVQKNETVIVHTEAEGIEEYDPGCGDGLEETQQPTNLPQKCIYKTSDGICFTTKIFAPKPLNYYDCTGGSTTYNHKAYSSSEYCNMGINTCSAQHDYWAGAMKMCHDWGYKLASAEDLTSLVNDIYGVKVSGENGVSSYLQEGKNPNKAILALLGLKNTDYFSLYLWEDKEVNERYAYSRYITNFTTKRYDGSPRALAPALGYCAICVYNPYGKVKTSYDEYRRQQLKQAQEKQQQKQENLKNEAKNALF